MMAVPIAVEPKVTTKPNSSSPSAVPGEAAWPELAAALDASGDWRRVASSGPVVGWVRAS